MDAPSQTVNVGDVDLSVVRVGTGPPILLCGGPQLGHSYMRHFDFLADTHECIYYDARGSGKSPLGNPSELSAAGAVADAEGLRAGLGLERLTLVGHSLGAHVAYLYASKYPQRVDSLVLVDVGPPLSEDQMHQLERGMAARRSAADDARLAQIQASAEFARRDTKAVEDFIRNVYAPFFNDRRNSDSADYGFTDITAANVLGYEERMVRSLFREDPPTRMAAIRCPTLVMHGELDPIPLAFAQQLAALIPGARLAVIPGSSHFPFVEDAEPFQATIRAFLAAWPSGQGRHASS
jgi:proline-specific peptidase